MNALLPSHHLSIVEKTFVSLRSMAIATALVSCIWPQTQRFTLGNWAWPAPLILKTHEKLCQELAEIINKKIGDPQSCLIPLLEDLIKDELGRQSITPKTVFIKVLPRDWWEHDLWISIIAEQGNMDFIVHIDAEKLGVLYDNFDLYIEDQILDIFEQKVELNLMTIWREINAFLENEQGLFLQHNLTYISSTVMIDDTGEVRVILRYVDERDKTEKCRVIPVGKILPKKPETAVDTSRLAGL
jgi:hypothetical protein